MKRKAIDRLIKWKKLNNKKPIFLTGAKGVGKTYLAYDFARAFFEHIYYLNFEQNPLLTDLFLPEDPVQTKELLKEYLHLNQDQAKEERILIMDETSFCDAVMKLVDKAPLSELFDYIILISSNPVPVKEAERVILLPVYPLEFDEFLRATGNEWYIELIMTHYSTNTRIPDIVHKELLDLYQLYLQIGGMPGVINEYLNLASPVNVSEQHSFLTGAYHDFIMRNNPESEALKMIQVFDSMLLQLMKDNRKFQYKLIRKGTTHAMYKDAIRKLADINYVIKCDRISNEQLKNPSDTFKNGKWTFDEDNTNFKLYLSDTGLLYSRIAKENGSSSQQLLNKALLENDTAQCLQAKQYPFVFWESDSMAKIDFILYKNDSLIPIEIYENDNTRSKSISVLRQICSFPYAVKISSRNFEFSNQIKYVPYYAAFCL